MGVWEEWEVIHFLEVKKIEEQIHLQDLVISLVLEIEIIKDFLNSLIFDNKKSIFI